MFAGERNALLRSKQGINLMEAEEILFSGRGGGNGILIPKPALAPYSVLSDLLDLDVQAFDFLVEGG